jgi:hypothetical protein
VRTDGSGNIWNFLHDVAAGNNYIHYRSGPYYVLPFRLVVGGTATTETTVSAANVVPVTSRLGYFRLGSLTTNGVVAWTGTSDDSVTVPGAGIFGLVQGADLNVTHPLNSSQQLTYAYSSAPATDGVYIDVRGYWFMR